MMRSFLWDMLIHHIHTHNISDVTHIFHQVGAKFYALIIKLRQGVDFFPIDRTNKFNINLQDSYLFGWTRTSIVTMGKTTRQIWVFEGKLNIFQARYDH
jgi:hypothetical protein